MSASGPDGAPARKPETHEAAPEARPVRVIAAVIERNGRYLVGRRPEGKRHGGLWEFPGGKIADGESDLQAARRELGEELRLGVRSVGPTLFARRDPQAPFLIEFVEVHAVGAPVALEHGEIGWFPPSGLAELELAPADADFVAWLRRERG